jgi:hypothetical protein
MVDSQQGFPKRHSILIVLPNVTQDSVVGIATGYGLDDREVGVRVPIESRNFSSPIDQTGSGVPPTSYSMGTGRSLPGSKAAGA